MCGVSWIEVEHKPRYAIQKQRPSSIVGQRKGMKDDSAKPLFFSYCVNVSISLVFCWQTEVI